MSLSALRRPGRGWRALLLAVAATCTVLGVPTANAATITLSGTDPVETETPKFDLISAKAVYDNTAGKVSVTVQTAAPNAGVIPFAVFVVLGKAVDGKCEPDGEKSPVVLVAMSWESDIEATNWIVTGATSASPAPTTRSGATVTSTAGPASNLRNLPLDCAQVLTKTSGPGADGGTEAIDVDDMSISTAGGASPIFTTEPDKDKDGVADRLDKCPTEPGAAANGCATLPAKLAVRLGAKRVAIDKLVARTAKVCPVKAKVTVKVGKKTIGSGVISVTTHGSFCRAYGVVKLKKSAKKAKITVKATGMGTISASRKR